MDLVAGRYEPVPEDAGGILNPARDTVSGELVTVLRTAAPVDPLPRFQELDRLRRYAAGRVPHLAGIRAVELLAGEFRLACDPVTGVVLDPGAPPAGLTLTHVRQIAAGLLDAVAALHVAGVPWGWVRSGAVVVHTSPRGATVTLLPFPQGGAEPVAEQLPGSAADERRLAATLLLGLLPGIPLGGPEEQADAHRLRLALAGAGGAAEQPWGPAGSALFPPVHRGHAPAPLASSPLSLAPLPPALPPADGPAPPGSPRTRAPGTRRRPSRRSVLEASAAGIALGATVAVVVAGATMAGSPGGRGEQPVPPAARPAATTTTTSPSAAASTTATPPAWDLPTTVPALVSALSARPDAAGPSGPLLLDALRGLMAADPGAAPGSALRLVTLVVGDPGVDPRYGAASLVALADDAIPGAPDTGPTCFTVGPGTPDPVVQQDAQQVLERLAGWQAQGLPQDEADRLRGLAAPVAAARAVPTLAPCPSG